MRQFDNYANGGQGNHNQDDVAWNELLGNTLSTEQSQRYGGGFSPVYRHDFTVEDAQADIALFESISNNNPVAMRLYKQAADADNVIRFRLMQKGHAIALSDALPILENFGLRVIGEVPYPLTFAGEQVYLHVYELHTQESNSLDTHQVAKLFEDAFQHVWEGHAESDAFNTLVFSAAENWRSIAMLRAYSRYMKQINLQYTRPFIAATLAKHTSITQKLCEIFETRFNPSLDSTVEERKTLSDALEEQILQELDAVDNLNEDSVIREYMTLLNATLRTNFYQLDGDVAKQYFSFKLDTQNIPKAPKPRPMFEIFVYSPRLEGVHLRGGKVARGGLRWSDRQEDFRTEVLGLVKAQQVKNSVIVPMGAKGGFVCKQAPCSSDREAFLAEGVACYRTFISSLLDVTDNLVDGKLVPPQNVIRWDSDDPYLVVAADKGTATFSDIANEISNDYGFWLGDAFASGGSVGYDHKGMGITAKGAWVSVQRHFRELNVNVQQEDFTVVGVGDMAGDVFGNGMLCSEHIQLVAAFNHMHIFIDPNPNAAASFVERKRLFELPRSSWTDYNAELISQGGGIFECSAKSIAISPQMKARFALERDEMTPNELIHAILKAPVDLFWNGGIGTYMKASTETHADVGDKANDCLRINANEMGARVIGEGGNLGTTQLARVEYCLNGGACNTDFIDNAAGVDCSDHEVNIKILLDDLVAHGNLDSQGRNTLLESMTDAVSDLVLENNYRQTQAISLAEYESSQRDIEYRRLITHYESLGKLDRQLEFIPTDDVLAERRASGHALTRPELSVLVSYSKLMLKEALAESDIATNEYISAIAHTAFPAVLREKYAEEIDTHTLNKEIVATQLAGDLVNRMGITFVHRMQQATGESVENIAKAYVAARDLFNIDSRWRAIESLDYQLSAEHQNEMFAQLIRLVRRTTRWLLRARRSNLDPAVEILFYQSTAQNLADHLGDYLQGEQKEAFEAKAASYVEGGVPAELARFVASARYLYTTFAIAEAAENTQCPVDHVADCYFDLGDRLQLCWFADQIVKMGVENYWQAMARETFRDDLEEQQASLVESLMKNVQSQHSSLNQAARVDEWFEDHEAYISRWHEMVSELKSMSELDIAMFPVAIRELLDLSQASKNNTLCFDIASEASRESRAA